MKVINTWIFNTTTKYMGRMVENHLIIYQCEGGKWCQLENGVLKTLTEEQALRFVSRSIDEKVHAEALTENSFYNSEAGNNLSADFNTGKTETVVTALTPDAEETNNKIVNSYATNEGQNDIDPGILG